MRPPSHVPHLSHPEVVTMGMRPMTGTWLEPDTTRQQTTARKCDLRARLGSAVYQVLPEGLGGACELAGQVWLALGIDPPLATEADPLEALWQASLQVAEDLVVMAPHEDGYRLVGASLCSPSHWRLSEKIGRPMARIHDPIPTIHERLSAKIDRVFDHLRVDHPVERFNWSVQEDDTLFCWPSEHAEPLPVSTPLFYRVERQTLSRLPQSGALAFTIRVHIDPLESLSAVPGAMAALFAAVDANPASVQAYKNFGVLEPALEKYRQYC